ncbi:glutathione S-transferase T2-like [Brassica napus]|uniref:glutathione S-transferase T2-like n=1 Tax=Brassica napus TaxID=3708 RepID=UPI002078BCF2|nr:glutathione S-transferase T2-like [Brassica napus]
MDPRNPLNPYSESPSYSYLLHSQNFQYGSYPSTQYPSEIPPYSSQQPDGPPEREDPAVASKERRQWTPADDEVVISAWLNTSKDAVVGNEQKSGTFWKRVAEYCESTPHAKESGEPREWLHIKQRWQKINDLTNKFCGAYSAAERQITSGQSETDVLKMAYDIYYADHKRKFNLEYAWCVLRFEQKWLSLNTPKPTKPTGSAKRKAGEECSSTTVGDEEVRPEGVKAAKARRKVGQGKSLADVTTVMEMKERLSKVAILDTLLAKTGPLSEAEEIVKNKLLAQYF